MFNSYIVELVLGVAFVFAVLGAVTTAMTEAVLSLLKVRSKYLQQWLEQLLQGGKAGPGLSVAALMQRGVIAPLGSGPAAAPSYIPSNRLATALIEMAALPPGQTMVARDAAAAEASLRRTIEAMPPCQLRGALLSLLNAAVVETGSGAALLERFQREVAAWIDQSMDRVTGWVKRHSKLVSLIVAFAICAALNVNVVSMVRHLSVDPETRSALVKKAVAMNSEGQPQDQQACAAEADPVRQAGCYAQAGQAGVDALGSLSSLGIGWEPLPSFLTHAAWSGSWSVAVGTVLTWLMGLLASTFAVSLGGDFWFKLISEVIRLTGTKPAKAPLLGAPK
jgi:hypothetical protein